MSEIVHSEKGTRAAQVRAFASSLANGTSLNRPRDWQAFERLARDLFGRITGDVHTDLHGRNGQPQSGVDVVGVDQHSRARVGVQCRGRGDDSAWSTSRLTGREIQAEVEKARRYYPKLDVFVILTTGPNDVTWTKTVARLNERHRRSGDFEIQVHGWDWIEGKLGSHFDLAVQHGLIAVVTPIELNTAPSMIAREIGCRLMAGIGLMNFGPIKTIGSRCRISPNTSAFRTGAGWKK